MICVSMRACPGPRAQEEDLMAEKKITPKAASGGTKQTGDRAAARVSKRIGKRVGKKVSAKLNKRMS